MYYLDNEMNVMSFNIRMSTKSDGANWWDYRKDLAANVIKFYDCLLYTSTKLYSARIIPFKGSWIEFATDINNVMYAYIDRKKQLPVTTLLRAIGFESDKDILEIFNLAEEVKEMCIRDRAKLEQYFDGIISAEVSLKVVKPESAKNKEAAIRLIIKRCV